MGREIDAIKEIEELKSEITTENPAAADVLSVCHFGALYPSRPQFHCIEPVAKTMAPLGAV